MLRKTTLCLILSLASPGFAGLYIGAAIGPEGARFKKVSHVTRVNTFDVIDTNNFAGVGFFGSIFAGYAKRINNLFLAGELNANLSSVEYEVRNDEYVHRNFQKSTFTVKSSQGISVLPGYYLNDATVFFGRLGYAHGKIKINEKTDNTIPSSEKWRPGFRWGVGIQ